MKYYLIAGERSGDLHAANLMKAIKEEDQAAEFRFWGGDEMKKVGGEQVKHYSETAFMGIWEVVLNLPKIFGFIKLCKEDIKTYQPDVVILIDYAGFNMRIAKFIKKEGLKIPVFYYISPKVWAWNTKRALKIKANVDRLFCIFPFEEDFFKEFDYKVDYVGNPLLDAIATFKANSDFKTIHQIGEKPVIALLPGSRKQEVAQMLPLMMSLKPAFPAYQFIIAGVSNLPKEDYQAYTDLSEVKIIYDEAYNLLTIAEAAVVTSGTATLETALFEVPQVVVYKTSFITYWIGRMLIKTPFFSLANLVAQKEVVKEFVKEIPTTQKMIAELKKITKGGEERERMLQDYKEIKVKIGKAGASQRAGKLMIKYLKEPESDLSNV